MCVHGGGGIGDSPMFVEESLQGPHCADFFFYASTGRRRFGVRYKICLKASV